MSVKCQKVALVIEKLWLESKNSIQKHFAQRNSIRFMCGDVLNYDIL